MKTLIKGVSWISAPYRKRRKTVHGRWTIGHAFDATGETWGDWSKTPKKTLCGKRVPNPDTELLDYRIGGGYSGECRACDKAFDKLVVDGVIDERGDLI